MSLGSQALMWLFVALSTVGFVLLLAAIFSLLKTLENSILQIVPLAPETRLKLDFAGKADLYLEAPMFAFGVGFLSYEILDPKTGQPLRLRHGVPIKVSGFDTVRILQRVVFVPQPGEYLLRVGKLDSQKDYANYNIVFTRPYSFRIVLHIFALIITGGMFAVGMVFAMIASQGKL